MKCNRCDSPEELVWPQNYVKGNKPINVETNKIHICDTILRYTCPCGTRIIQFKGERELCSTCQLERFRN